MKNTPPLPVVEPAPGNVIVRMFCQGLGDCFLLSIPQEGNTDYHVLIDCGVAMGTDNAQGKMQDVVQQIKEITGGTIDVLVITHEHWDHVSGFTQAQDLWYQASGDDQAQDASTKLKVKTLWMAWTEDPKDDLARDLKTQYGKAKMAAFQALAAVERKQNHPGMDKIRAGVEGVLAFYGLDPSLGAAKNAGMAGTNDLDGAMKIAKALVENDSTATCFLLPGETHALPSTVPGTTAAGIKVRVLGPPHDGAMVRKLNSSTETYDKQQAHFGGVSWAWMGALAESAADSLTVDEDAAMPFENVYRIPSDQARNDPFFKSHYYDSPAGSDPEKVEGFALRRIDGDWLARGAQQLALWINSYTNNVSLVLALELPKSGNVLLFVGDAQVGNWLSWHNIKTFKDAADKEVAMQNLFERTVLYKVGHHGSHNATLRQRGLEMMTHPDLVAMLPVDHERAAKLGYGEMPLESLQAAIKQRADGRLLRLDQPWQNDLTPGDWPSNLSKAKLVTRPNHIVSYMEYAVADK